MDILSLELRKLGLTEKEAKVYLAGLELGPCSVQAIAVLAKITRPTAYEIIKKLKEKSLFTETKNKKKNYFIAQSPENILSFLRVKKREVEEKEREFIRIIASLAAKYSKEREGVKVYKGKEGIKVLEEIISFSPTSDIIIINYKQSLKPSLDKIKKRLGRLELKKIDSNLSGTIIIFDKVIFLPEKKQEGYLIE